MGELLTKQGLGPIYTCYMSLRDNTPQLKSPLEFLQDSKVLGEPRATQWPDNWTGEHDDVASMAHRSL